MNVHLIQRLRLLENDHEPEGWPAIQMRDISALCAIAEAAQTYFDHYVQDEAQDVEACLCGQEQHERAIALRTALEAAR